MEEKDQGLSAQNCALRAKVANLEDTCTKLSEELTIARAMVASLELANTQLQVEKAGLIQDTRSMRTRVQQLARDLIALREPEFREPVFDARAFLQASLPRSSLEDLLLFYRRAFPEKLFDGKGMAHIRQIIVVYAGLSLSQRDTLSLANRGLDDAMLEELSIVLRQDGKNLKTLDLADNHLTDARVLLNGGPRGLTTLSLAGNPLGDAGLQRLTKLLREPSTSFPFIETLDLSRCGLTIRSVAHLCAWAKRCTTIRVLRLSGNRLGGGSASFLAVLVRFVPNLRELWLCSCGLTDRSVLQGIGGVFKAKRRTSGASTPKRPPVCIHLAKNPFSQKLIRKLTEGLTGHGRISLRFA